MSEKVNEIQKIYEEAKKMYWLDNRTHAGLLFERILRIDNTHILARSWLFIMYELKQYDVPAYCERNFVLDGHLQRLQKLVEEDGDANGDAELLLGGYYYYVVKHAMFDMAEKLYRKSGEKGCIYAFNNLAHMYITKKEYMNAWRIFNTYLQSETLDKDQRSYAEKRMKEIKIILGCRDSFADGEDLYYNVVCPDTLYICVKNIQGNAKVITHYVQEDLEGKLLRYKKDDSSLNIYLKDNETQRPKNIKFHFIYAKKDSGEEEKKEKEETGSKEEEKEYIKQEDVHEEKDGNWDMLDISETLDEIKE